MRVNLIKTLVLAVLVSVGIVSCTEKEESTNVPITITDDNEVVYTIEASVLPCDVWTTTLLKTEKQVQLLCVICLVLMECA